MRLRSAGMIICALCFVTQSIAKEPELQFDVVSDVEYCTGGGKPLLMDLLIPRHHIGTPTPTVLWIHGGGWEHGDKNAHSGGSFLADHGFVTATISYRLSGDSPFPAAIEDCKCAIRFLRANAAKYGIDPERIGVAGSSAGGHLAELVATSDQSAGFEGDGGWQPVSSRVQAAASYYGVSDLTMRFPQETSEVIERFLQATRQGKPELYRKASPIFYVSKDDPPLLLVHGQQDDGVPFEQSSRMAEAYRGAGLKVEFIAVMNAGHDFEHKGDAPILPSVESVHQRTVDFFKHYLGTTDAAQTGH
jgi:acetyl esterase/lipase